jgi:hypothetical protein
MILKWSEIRWKSMDWIDMAQDRDKFVGVVNTVMNHCVP